MSSTHALAGLFSEIAAHTIKDHRERRVTPNKGNGAMMMRDVRGLFRITRRSICSGWHLKASEEHSHVLAR